MSDKKEKGLIPTEVVEIKPLEFPKCNIFLDHEPDFSDRCWPDVWIKDEAGRWI